MITQISNLALDGNQLPVTFLESQQVQEGVTCDIYRIDGDDTKDLAIIEIQPGFRSPRQRISPALVPFSASSAVLPTYI